MSYSPDLKPQLYRSEHFPSLIKLEHEVFSAEDAWSENSMREEVTANPEGFRLIVPSSKVIAYVQFQLGYDRLPEDEGDGRDGQIGSIAVDHLYRGRGLATSLVTTAIDTLRERDAAKIIFGTRESNVPMLRLGVKLGFQPVGVKPAYYKNPDGTREDGIRMELRR